MFKIKTLNTIAAAGLNQFPRDLYEVSADIQHPDAILVRSKVLHEMVIPDSVKAIGRAGAGINNIPLATLTKRGIPVFNTPGANANAVRELVIAGMLLASRHIFQVWNYLASLNLSNDLHEEIEQNKKQFVGIELMGKTLGIIGLGSIGVKVANTAVSLGMDVIGYDPTITINRAWELSAHVKQAHSIDELLPQVDFISFHVPLTEATKQMINPSRLQLIKKGAVILNFARDGIIDKEALIAAIQDKRVANYVTDFPCTQLMNRPGVICLPHLGASTKEAEENCAVMIAKQVRDFLETGAIVNSANFPNMDIPACTTGVRLAIANSNIPSMVAQISSKLGEAGLNIISIMNKSRDEIAYTLIDINNQVSDNVLTQIRQIEGVLQLRCLAY